MFNNPESEILAETITLDGCWFCTKREVVDNYKFDEDLFKGYHCYDLDFCLTVGQKYKVAVTYEILLKHLSEGSYNLDWLIETIKLHKKWGSNLPKMTKEVSTKEIFHQELIAYNEWIKRMDVTKYPNKALAISLYFSRKFISVIELQYWLLFPFYVLKYLANKTYVKFLYKIKLRK